MEDGKLNNKRQQNYFQNIDNSRPIERVEYDFLVFPVPNATLPLVIREFCALFLPLAAAVCEHNDKFCGNIIRMDLINFFIHLSFSCSILSVSACSASSRFFSCFVIFFLPILMNAQFSILSEEMLQRLGNVHWLTDIGTWNIQASVCVCLGPPVFNRCHSKA